jgi:hypothetical protein
MKYYVLYLFVEHVIICNYFFESLPPIIDFVTYSHFLLCMIEYL